jgi:thioredoxin reductase
MPDATSATDLKPVAPAFDTDVVVVGAGPAGLSAALTLGRAGRPTVLFDGGPGRNHAAAHAHGFLTRDGIPPETLRADGRQEVECYGVDVREARVGEARRVPGGFHVWTEAGESGERACLSCRVLVVATGVVDELPEIEGLAEAWGVSAVHCPYCHGHEFRHCPTAVLGRGHATLSMAETLRGWTEDITIVSNGPEHLTDDQERELSAAGIAVERAPIRRLVQTDGQVEAVEFVDGRRLPCRVFYLQPPQRMGSGLAESLGATVTDRGRIDADADGRTTVPGLFVAGDLLNRAQQIATAVAGGAWAGIAANHDLVVGPPEPVGR